MPYKVNTCNPGFFDWVQKKWNELTKKPRPFPKPVTPYADNRIIVEPQNWPDPTERPPGWPPLPGGDGDDSERRPAGLAS